MRDALFLFEFAAIREVYVVPNFISEGYFTQAVIPRELELTDRMTERIDGQIWKYCEPVGNHRFMTELLLQRAVEVAPGVPESETTLLIVGHGTSLNDNSAVAAKRVVSEIQQRNRYAEVLSTYMEEPPLIADWAKMTKVRNVVVVPFFISDGLHSYEDIPELLGIRAEQSSRDQFQGNPHNLHGRSLYYASSIGTDARVADLILEQAKVFDDNQPSPPANFARELVR